MSFYTSLSGLQAAQTDLSTISHNLANVATNGFKKSATQFADVIASTSSSNPNHTVGSGTIVKSIRQSFDQGGFKSSASALDIAISGDGFFVVKGTGASGDVAYTRNGSFSVDSNRYVVDSLGKQLQVYPVDGSGAVIATGIDSTVPLRLPETSGAPKPTANVTLGVNLSSSARAPANSDAFQGKTYAFDRSNPNSYNYSAQTTIYDAAGTPATLTSYFVRQPADASGNSDWAVYSFVGDRPLGTSGGAAGPVTLRFDASGKRIAPAAPVTLDGFAPAGGASNQPITLDLGGSTQTSNAFSVVTRNQDGAAVGQFQSVAVREDGAVTATFSNGDTRVLGKVVLATFDNPAGLRQLGNSSWAASGLSGQPDLGLPGDGGYGSLMSGAIEQSNVDMTAELVALIAAQRNYQANAKALDTQNQISQTIFNMRS